MRTVIAMLLIDWRLTALSLAMLPFFMYLTFRVGKVRRAISTDDATWLRGRARALSMAIGHLPYYQHINPVMADNARYTIREVLADYWSSG